MHLVDIGCGMKPIGILELPMQSLSEQRANGRLAAPRNTHEDDYGCKKRRAFLTHDSSSKTDPPSLILIAAIPRARQGDRLANEDARQGEPDPPRYHHVFRVRQFSGHEGRHGVAAPIDRSAVWSKGRFASADRSTCVRSRSPPLTATILVALSRARAKSSTMVDGKPFVSASSPT